MSLAQGITMQVWRPDVSLEGQHALNWANTPYFLANAALLLLVCLLPLLFLSSETMLLWPVFALAFI